MSVLSASVELPSAQTLRWTAYRKAAVVRAIRDGIITLDDAMSRYSLTSEELHSWMRHFRLHGRDGLRASHLQYYRELDANADGSQSAKTVAAE